MLCNKCGKEIDNDVQICPFCGAELQVQNRQTECFEQAQGEKTASDAQQFTPPAQNDEAPGQNNTQQQYYAYNHPGSNIPYDLDRKTVSKKDYINKYATAALRKNINSTAYLLYGLSVFSLVLNFVMAGFNWITLVEIGVLVALIVGMHIGKSKICAILLLIASIAETVLTLILSGQLAGWWWIIASVYAISCFNKLDKEYNSFLMNANGNGNPYYSHPQPEFVPSAQAAQPVLPPVQNDEASIQNNDLQQQADQNTTE